MFARIARSWELMKQSWHVLRQDKELLLFPIFSSLACLLVMASFALPIALSPTVRESLFASVKAEREPAELAGGEQANQLAGGGKQVNEFAVDHNNQFAERIARVEGQQGEVTG